MATLICKNSMNNCAFNLEIQCLNCSNRILSDENFTDIQIVTQALKNKRKVSYVTKKRKISLSLSNIQQIIKCFKSLADGIWFFE